MRVVITKKANSDCHYIRETVFIDEQKFSVDKDEIDDKAFHVVIYDEDRPIGTGRCFYTDENKEEYHIGRVAVLKEYRGKRIGEMIIKSLEEKIKEEKGKEIIISAQVRVKDFYKKMGYEEIGSIYLDEYCEHIDMKKKI